jgi:mono/diheme cytochrome c family protein
MRTRSIFTFVSAFLGAASAVHAQREEQQQVQLAEGSGTQIVQVICAQCHSLNRPVIDREYALSDAAEAISYVGEGRARGKVIIKVL